MPNPLAEAQEQTSLLEGLSKLKPGTPAGAKTILEMALGEYERQSELMGAMQLRQARANLFDESISPREAALQGVNPNLIMGMQRFKMVEEENLLDKTRRKDAAAILRGDSGISLDQYVEKHGPGAAKQLMLLLGDVSQAEGASLAEASDIEKDAFRVNQGFEVGNTAVTSAAFNSLMKRISSLATKFGVDPATYVIQNVKLPGIIGNVINLVAENKDDKGKLLEILSIASEGERDLIGTAILALSPHFTEEEDLADPEKQLEKEQEKFKTRERREKTVSEIWSTLRDIPAELILTGKSKTLGRAFETPIAGREVRGPSSQWAPLNLPSKTAGPSAFDPEQILLSQRAAKDLLEQENRDITHLFNR